MVFEAPLDYSSCRNNTRDVGPDDSVGKFFYGAPVNAILAETPISVHQILPEIVAGQVLVLILCRIGLDSLVIQFF